MIYFVECGDFIKIGHTDNVKRRVRAFKSANPYPVNLLFDAPGGFAAERRLHKRFAAFHHQGEWFRKTPELLAGIERARVELESNPEKQVELNKHEFALELARIFKLTPNEMKMIGLFSDAEQTHER